MPPKPLYLEGPVEILDREEAKSRGLKTYYSGRPCKRGHISYRLTSGFQCTECAREDYQTKSSNADWVNKLKSNRNRELDRVTSLKSYKIRRKIPEIWLRIALKRSKMRAKKMGWEFNVTTDDVIFPEYCPYLGIRLVIGESFPPKDDNPSIDRIDSTKGYIKGNVEVVSLLANRIKSNASPSDIMKVALRLAAMQKTGNAA